MFGDVEADPADALRRPHNVLLCLVFLLDSFPVLFEFLKDAVKSLVQRLALKP